MRRFAPFMLFTTLLLSGCKRTMEPTEQHTPKQYIVVADLSVSRSHDVLEEEQAFVTRLASELGFGDQIVLLQMQQANLKDLPLRLTFDMPEPRRTKPTQRDRQNLKGQQETVTDSVPQLFKAQGDAKVQHTDIFSTLIVVGERLHDRGAASSTEVILLSDMLQSAEGYEMERLARMPGQDWLQKSVRAGKLPHLDGACIAVIGEDTSSKDDPAIKQFWQEYFKAAGASLASADVRMTAPESVHSLCRS